MVQIGGGAFFNAQLTSVTIPDSVIEIGIHAFAWNQLTEVIIPDSVQILHGEVFFNNPLVSVNIGSGVKGISGDDFLNTPLMTIKVDENNPYFKDIDGKGLYNADESMLIAGTTSGEISANAKHIGWAAFGGRGLTSTVIPDGVEIIGMYAFEYNLLEHVTIPDSVEAIRHAAFRGNRLKTVEIGEGVKFIDIEVFADNQLIKVTIPDNVTDISRSSFRNNPELVLSGLCGSEAENHARLANILYLSECQPLVIQFGQNGSGGAEVQRAATKVNVYSYEELATEQYYIWTKDDGTPPAFDLSTWTAFASGQELTRTDDGQWYLHVHAKDSDGNDTARSSQLFRVVNLPPEIHLSATIGAAGTPYTEGEWAGQPVHVNIRADDVNMKEMHIKIRNGDDEEDWMAAPADGYVFQRTFAGNGIYQLAITATDEANQTTKESYTIKISLDGLQLDVTLKQADGTELHGQWTNQSSVTASVYAYNVQGARVTEVVYSLDAGITWAPYAGPLIFTDEGAHELRVRAKDEAGHTLTEQLLIGIDRTAPSIHFAPDGSADGLRNVSSEVTATDGLSGIDTHALYYVWSKDKDPLGAEADWSPFHQGEKLNYAGTSGEWYLHIRARDVAGNERYQISRPFFLRQPAGGGGGGGSHHDDDRSNANMRELDVSVGQLTPSFSEEITDYEVHVDHDVTNIVITVKAVHPEATISINGEPVDDDQETVELLLEAGTNAFSIAVAAPDGTEKTYTLTVVREQAERDEQNLAPRFTDLAGHWATSAILEAAARGIANGYPDGTFKPDNPVTRAEFAVMLMGVMPYDGSGAALSFTDADEIGPWARQAIAGAVQSGIVAGYGDGSFRPHAAITRAEMAVMIARALQLPSESDAVTGFADDEDVPLWAKGAVAANRDLGLIGGRGGNRLMPNDSATRAEAMVVLLKLARQLAN